MAKPKVHEAWTVLAHRPIEKLEANVWRVEGDLPKMPLKRVMTVARRADGRLVVHNPIALDEASMREIDAWGEVAFLVVPNGWHRLDARPFCARYPAARVYVPRGARAKVEEVVQVHGTYDEFPPDADVTLAELDGTAGNEGVMTVRSGGRTTLVFNDALFNMPHLPGLQGFVLKHLTQSSGGPRVSRVGKLFLVKGRDAFRAHLQRLATPDLARVIVSHHETITERPAEALRAVAAAL